MKKRVVDIRTIQTILASEDGYDNVEEWLKDAKDLGYWAPYRVPCLVEVENMGFCKDGLTRWYTFKLQGCPCICFID